MTGKNENRPKGSEISVNEWLRQIGATGIRFTGGPLEKGAPDFEIDYGGERIAVQVTLLHDRGGWSKERECAVLREARKLYDGAYNKRFSWHGWIEYDPRESEKAMTRNSWQNRMRDALSKDGGEFQLLCDKKKRGRGVILTLHPTRNEGGIISIDVDQGFLVESTVLGRIGTVLNDKTKNTKKYKQYTAFDQWWLVLDDEILIAPRHVLQHQEIKSLEKHIRDSPDRIPWSKIVLMSRFHTVFLPSQPPKRFWPLWEDDAHKSLPDSP